MKRAREDRALEVWIGGGRELAGWLTSLKNIPMSVKDILIAKVSHDENGDDWIDETRPFELTPVHRVIAAVDIARNGEDWLETQVPLYALPTKLISDQTQYAWRVLRVTQEEYDWVFDHPAFVPVDTGPDRDQMANASVLSRDDLEAALGYALSDRSAPTSLQEIIDAVSTASSTATSSAMLSEQLSNAVKSILRSDLFSKSGLTSFTDSSTGV